MPKIDIELNQIFFNLAIVLRFNYNLWWYSSITEEFAKI